MATDPTTLCEPAPAIDRTYKAREVEGIFDLLFYRKIGFQLAKFFARGNFTPTTVTLIGGIFGVAAGHFYFYPSVVINLAGLALQIVANIFDNADGQLARLTGQQSRTGRILDSVVDHIIWLSIYVHLGLRLQIEGFSASIWILVAAAGISHGWQAAAADYWRNAFLYLGKGRGELESASAIKQQYLRAKWFGETVLKVLLGLHLGVAREQELMLPGVKRLHEKVKLHFDDDIPNWFQSGYSAEVIPTFKWWGLLMTNSRMLVLFVLFLVRQPVWYFWLEVTAANLLLLYLIARQQLISRCFSHLLTTQNKG